jgi:hypothetical protein
MASSGNFMTWSSLWSCDSSYPPSSNVFSGGNCRYSSSNSNNGFGATYSFLSGKWYWEVYIVANGNKQLILGVVTPETKIVSQQLWNTVGIYGVTSGSGIGYKLIENSPGFVEINGFDDIANGDIVQLAFDRDNYKLWVGRNNTWLESGNPAGDSNPLISGSDFAFQGGPVMPVIGQGSSSTFTMVLNAGQDDTFGGEITAAGNADGNGHGVFKYAPPSGFLAPCSANLPISDDIDPAQTNDDYPQKQFFISQYAGNLTNRTITTEAQPDLIMIRTYDNAQDWYVLDSSRGITANKYSFTNKQDAEATLPQSNFQSVGSTSVGISSGTYLNSTGANYQMWMWRANGGTTSSDSSGDITVTRQTNTAGGFSILTYTGNGSSDQTIAHGLGKSPAFIITKNRSSTSHWAVWHHQYTGYYGQLESNGTWASDSSQFYTSGMTSNFIGVKGSGATNESGDNMLAYVWTEIEGYSRFGRYKGNGNADGPFIYLGFRPAMIFFRRTDSSSGWTVVDTARYTANTSDGPGRLEFNLNNAETTGSSALREMDVLSNGIKIRTSNGNINTDGGDYVFGAWAEVPFRYNNAR